MQSVPQHGVPMHVVRFDSHPSSALGAEGSLQLPQPGRQLELHSPFVHSSVLTSEPEQVRPQLPQSEVSVPVFVSQPCEGSPVQ
jgi:hypothetical protein